MNRIILIGNGFDLAHKLRTKYIHFITDYWDKFKDRVLEGRRNYEDNCISFKVSTETLLDTIFNKNTNFSYQILKQQVLGINTKAIYNRNEENVSFIIKNKFLEHISDQSQSGLNTWLDIENEYYKFLSHSVNKDRTNRNYFYTNISQLNSDFNQIKSFLEDYLFEIISQDEIKPIEKINEIIYSSFRLKDLSQKSRTYIASQEHSKIIKYSEGQSLAEELNLSKKTIPHVEQYKHYDNESFKRELLQDDISDNHFDFKPDLLLFLSFNYTNLENMYIDEEKNENTEVIHIHGELKNDKNPMIFGYGDELEENYKKLENLQDNDLLENIKSIRYLETDNYKKLLDFMELDKYQIFILGHSCGNSDRTLLNTLFEHENCVSIKPYYYKNENNDNYNDIVKNISRNFTDKKDMRDKVVNKKYCEPFVEK